MPYTIPSSVISPGAVYQPRKSKLILDQISGAIAAWSTRRLISSAPADIARGRDASTTEQDFTAAELAGAGFTTLAGAGDGFYVTLYDQIGSNNATQSTAASQPKGVDTGTLITDGAGVPVMQFDGTQDNLITGATVIPSTTDFTFSINYTHQTPTANSNCYLFSQGGLLTSFVGVSISILDTLVFYFNGNVNISSAYNLTVGVKYLITLTRSGDLFSGYVNTSLHDDITIGAASLPSGSLKIGESTWTTGRYVKGNIDFFALWDRALTLSEISQLHTALL